MKLLFVCTHNRCRSIVAEAVARSVLDDRFEVRSAGSQPAGEVYPGTLVALQRHGISATGLMSQSWDAFELFAPDYVITVCDSAASEACPLWIGAGSKVHWGLADPSKIADAAAQSEAFDQLIATLKQRFAQVNTLDMTMSLAAIQTQLQSLAMEF
ncbi:arsenate reductase ArsC [Oceanobacter antarcticus]|jgi:arsenate reductase|uniref:Arsenate reductase ArsC n=1 Tax=Oceanobacter antarcticus TaxID=3133425 RepID=A0ABW8NGL5_9GAMM